MIKMLTAIMLGLISLSSCALFGLSYRGTLVTITNLSDYEIEILVNGRSETFKMSDGSVRYRLKKGQTHTVFRADFSGYSYGSSQMTIVIKAWSANGKHVMGVTQETFYVNRYSGESRAWNIYNENFSRRRSIFFW